MYAFFDLQQEREGMKGKTWIWWMNVCKGLKWKEGMKGLTVEHKDLEWMDYKDLEQMEYKDLEWTWKMNYVKLQAGKEGFWSWKKWQVYQNLETLFIQCNSYHFQQKM